MPASFAIRSNLRGMQNEAPVFQREIPRRCTHKLKSKLRMIANNWAAGPALVEARVVDAVVGARASLRGCAPQIYRFVQITRP